MKTKMLISFAALLFAASLVQAQIVVEATDTFQSTSASASFTFDASTYDKLVVVATGEHGFNNASGTVDTLTYDGQTLLESAASRNAQFATTDTIYNQIWYLDNPGDFHSAGSLDVSWQNRGSLTVFGLTGTAAGEGASLVTATDTRLGIVSGVNNGSIVISSFGMGGAGNGANVTNVTVDSPFTPVSAQENGSNWDGHVTSYYITSATGDVTTGYTGGTLDGAQIVALEFQAIPEPSSFALILIGLVGFVFLRRRS